MPKSSPKQQVTEAAPPKSVNTLSALSGWEYFLARFATGKNGRIIAGFGFVLLALHLLEFPHHTFDTTHDLSSHASFEYYAANKFQFGTDIYQNVGPYGYVHYAYTYIGYLHVQKVILKIICRLALALLAFWMGSCLKSPFAKMGWWLSFFAFYSFGDATDKDYLDLDENHAYITIFLTGLWLLQDRKDRWFQILSAAAWAFLAFMSLTKHTCFVLACSIVVLTLAQSLFRKHFLQAVLGLIVFSVALVIHWALAGQRLENLPAFVHGVFAFTGGYNEAMALITPWGALIPGLAVVILLVVRIVFNWWGEKAEFGRAAFTGFLLFVIWKHAFVRSDVTHLMIFFYAVLQFSIPIFFGSANSTLGPGKVDSPPQWPRFTFGWWAATALFCLASFYLVIPDCHYKPVRLWSHLCHNCSWLASPSKNTEEMKRQLREAKTAHELPQIKAIVQNGRIDFLGYDPGHILLNDLNYASRPMPITFAAANPLLQEANERFYRNPATAPEFILAQTGGVDDRFYPQDDALAFRAVMDNYRPVFMEKGLLLFRKRAESEFKKTRTEKFIGEQKVKLGNGVSLPDFQEHLAWLEVTVEPSLLGRLLSFFYKAPSCYIGVRLEGEQELDFRKFVTAMGDCGTTIQPLIASNYDLLNLFNPDVGLSDFGKVNKIALVCDEWDRKFFQPDVRLRWHVYERPGS